MTPVQRTSYDREVAAARTVLDDDAAFDLAWHEGRAMSMDQVVKYALEFDPGDDERDHAIGQHQRDVAIKRLAATLVPSRTLLTNPGLVRFR